MAVCLQSGGLIDTGSLSVQDGLQLSQFGISSNSPNLPISSEREQAQRASTFWMFFLSFRLSSRITPPISLCLPFPILYLSVSLPLFLSSSCFFAHAPRSTSCFLFIFIPSVLFSALFFPPLNFFLVPPHHHFHTLSLVSSLAVFFFVCVFLVFVPGRRLWTLSCFGSA